MTDADAQRAARTRAKIMDGLTRAERAPSTRPAPKSARARMKFLLTRAKGSTQAVAERLGISRRTVERLRSGAITKPQQRLQTALAKETEASGNRSSSTSKAPCGDLRRARHLVPCVLRIRPAGVAQDLVLATHNSSLL
ncbi:helix-turn-helix domain-containing protein [Streptomyces sp. CBMA152]|uniref:helix-turn-helix domain-containing protein n=1 Tax=Streptomyces sp. CBMA152 TaxID=1896312 RepID=UPI00166041EE|nr:helix-turn-helix domain-containing protein [Streptomyces sp. CBMA152]